MRELFQEVVLKLPEFINILAVIGMVISLVSTLVVKLTPSKLDDLSVENKVNKFLKVMSWFPTIGINPRTKALEEAYKELKGKNEPKAP